MTDSRQQRVVIIGAGLAGSLMACYLGREGYEVTVYEKLSDPRIGGYMGGRSINLALSERGLAALREVGLADEVLKRVIPMPGRMIHSRQGDTAFQAYSDNPNDRINSVSRGELSLLLIKSADLYPNVKFIFDHRCTNIDFSKPAITFLSTKQNKLVTVEADVIIGADGAFSAVRLQMMLNMDRFDYRQDYLPHGYKELTIPPTGAGEFAMNPNALHIWPRGGSMMIALPNLDKSFTCTCFWPVTDFQSLKTETEIRKHFETHYPDAVPLMPTLIEDFKRHPTSSLVTIHCLPWHFKGTAVLIGDAAHAIVPFFGQGMNCAFEDCSALAAAMRRGQPEWERVFGEFEAQRKPNADAIADMALDNFIEMRDKTASPVFRTRKKIEHALHHLFPKQFVPLYNMISFSTIPYAEARRRARRQAWALSTIGSIAASVVLTLLVLLISRML